MENHLHALAIALAITFVGPVIMYFVGVSWGNFVDRLFRGPRTPSEIKADKLWKTFCLGMPIFYLGLILVKDYANLRMEWERSPYLATLAALLFFVSAPCLLIAAIARVWRPRRNGY